MLQKSRAGVILKNSGALGASTVVGKAFYFLLFILIGRSLGPGELGKFTFALSFTAIFFLINDLGISILAVREVSQDKNRAQKYLGNLVLLKLLLSCLAFLGMFSLINLMGYPEETIKIVMLISLGAFLSHLSLGLRWIFQAYQKLKYESLVSITQNIGYFVLGFLALQLNLGIFGIG